MGLSKKMDVIRLPHTFTLKSVKFFKARSHPITLPSPATFPSTNFVGIAFCVLLNPNVYSNNLVHAVGKRPWIIQGKS